MTTKPMPSPNAARLERTYDAPAELIWELWTTAGGLQEWFAPGGFESRVSELELRPGGQLRYTMTATAPEQVAFMRNTGNPLSIELRKTFTEAAPPARLAYLSLIDRLTMPIDRAEEVPDVPPASANMEVRMPRWYEDLRNVVLIRISGQAVPREVVLSLLRAVVNDFGCATDAHGGRWNARAWPHGLAVRSQRCRN